jgi:hypothetical protein
MAQQGLTTGVYVCVVCILLPTRVYVCVCSAGCPPRAHRVGGDQRGVRHGEGPRGGHHLQVGASLTRLHTHNGARPCLATYTARPQYCTPCACKAAVAVFTDALHWLLGLGACCASSVDVCLLLL